MTTYLTTQIETASEWSMVRVWTDGGLLVEHMTFAHGHPIERHHWTAMADDMPEHLRREVKQLQAVTKHLPQPMNAQEAT